MVLISADDDVLGLLAIYVLKICFKMPKSRQEGGPAVRAPNRSGALRPLGCRTRAPAGAPSSSRHSDSIDLLRFPKDSNGFKNI